MVRAGVVARCKPSGKWTQVEVTWARVILRYLRDRCRRTVSSFCTEETVIFSTLEEACQVG